MQSLALIMEARRIIDDGGQLSSEHLQALRPFLKMLEAKMKPIERLAFIGNMESGFVIGATPFALLQGLAFIKALLMQATNEIEESRSISSAALYSWGAMGASGYMLSPWEPGVFPSQHPERDLGFQSADLDVEVSGKILAEMRAHKKVLEGQGHTPETNELMAFYSNQLKDRQHGGKSKTFPSEPEALRKNVESSIRYARDQIIDVPQERHIGLHLKDTIITGIDCAYIGDWKWRHF